MRPRKAKEPLLLLSWEPPGHRTRRPAERAVEAPMEMPLQRVGAETEGGAGRGHPASEPPGDSIPLPPSV